MNHVNICKHSTRTYPWNSEDSEAHLYFVDGCKTFGWMMMLGKPLQVEAVGQQNISNVLSCCFSTSPSNLMAFHSILVQNGLF